MNDLSHDFDLEQKLIYNCTTKTWSLELRPRVYSQPDEDAWSSEIWPSYTRERRAA